MEQIKAIFFDIDGTIYSHRTHSFLDSTKLALQQLKDKGFNIISATSRCQYEVGNLPSFFHTFDFDAHIYDGGALVLEKGTIIEEKPIDKEEIYQLINYCDAQKIAMRYSTFNSDYMQASCEARFYDEFFRLYLNIPLLKAYEGEHAYNILVYPQRDEQVQEIKQLLQNVSIVEHSKKTLEITAKNVGKDTGIQALCNHWHIDTKDIVCFGDGANDVGMLQLAGLGIAMGNANPVAKDAADKVCGHIDEDGLYTICKELHLI